ncbi:MAG: hypothetical protein AAF492_22950, partial [Verrucomicrobiota bacterium]
RLKVKDTNGNLSMPRTRMNPPLVREVTYSLLGEWLEKMHPFVLYGMGEFLASGEFQNKALDFSNHGSAVEAYLKRHRPGAGSPVKMVPLEELFGLEYPRWIKTGGEKKERLEATALLLLYYYINVEPKSLAGYFQAVDSGASNTVRDRKLIRGRSFSKLSNSVAAGLAKDGLKASF